MSKVEDKIERHNKKKIFNGINNIKIEYFIENLYSSEIHHYGKYFRTGLTPGDEANELTMEIN